jgi:hypothetical protein
MPRSCLVLVPFVLVVGLVPAAGQKLQVVGQPVGPALAPNPAPGNPNGTPPALTDEEALKAAGLSATDGPKLIGYLKQRTVSDSEKGKIDTLIKELGADLFADRIKAGESLELFGSAAIGLLKAAEKNVDPEIAYQATRVLKRMETIPHSAIAAAAVRAVVKLKPPGAAAALLGFLPLADSEALAQEIRGALIAIAAPNGSADPALIAALADASPLRRGAAYLALIQGGPATERIRIKDAYPQVTAAIRKDADAETKFVGLWALIRTARDKQFIPDLIDLIPKLSRGRIWQVEDLLLFLAGAPPEGGRFGNTPEKLAKARDAWLGWWSAQGGAIDLEKKAYKPRIQGQTVLVESDQRGFGMGRVVCLGQDMKEKWQIAGLNSVMDGRVQADGSIVTIENYSSVVVRNAAGVKLRTQLLNQAVAAQLSPDGDLLILGRQFINQYSKAGNQTWTYRRPNVADIHTGCRLPNGEVLFLTQAQQGNNCFRLDAKGQLIGKGTTIGRLPNINYGYVVTMDLVGSESILICETNRVAEYDLKTGKEKWKYATNSPTSVQRLPSGNTLVASLPQNRAVEVDPSGDVVWEYRAKDGLTISKAYRR